MVLEAVQSLFKRPSQLSSTPTNPKPPSSKVLHLLRHGQTEMNAYLEKHEYGSDGFVDPLLFDTQLTELGRRQAAAKATATSRLSPAPEVLLISPLRRTLQTAELAFPQASCPRVVEPLARERIWLSSDVGTARSELERQWPGHDFSQLEEVWWTTDAPDNPEAVCSETSALFADRVEELRQALGARQEQCVALVAHWGVLQALTGHSFHNCELQTFQYSQLRNWKEHRKPRL